MRLSPPSVVVFYSNADAGKRLINVHYIHMWLLSPNIFHFSLPNTTLISLRNHHLLHVLCQLNVCVRSKPLMDVVFHYHLLDVILLFLTCFQPLILFSAIRQGVIVFVKLIILDSDLALQALGLCSDPRK